MVSQAPTASRAFRVWQIQRQLDSDVDALSASKQENLGRFLARTGGDGRRTYADLRAVDSDTADASAAIDDPVTRRQFVTAYQRGEVDSDELATALGRCDESNASGKTGRRRGRRVGRRRWSSSSRPRNLVLVDVRDGPCRGTIESVYECYTDGVSGVTLSRLNAEELLEAYDEADGMIDRPGKNGPSTVQELINESTRRTRTAKRSTASDGVRVPPPVTKRNTQR